MLDNLAWISSLCDAGGGAAVLAGLFAAGVLGVLLRLFSEIASERPALEAPAGLLARGAVGFLFDEVGRFCPDFFRAIFLLSLCAASLTNPKLPS
jgi:hypothetical protein